MERIRSDIAVDQRIGLRIRQIREQRGMDPDAFCDLVGHPMTPRLLHDYELGIWPIPPSHLLRFADALETPGGVLLGVSE